MALGSPPTRNDDDGDGRYPLQSSSPSPSSPSLEATPSSIVVTSAAAEESPNAAASAYVCQTLPPRDKWRRIYLGFVLAGVGFLLPYNRYVLYSASTYYVIRNVWPLFPEGNS